jgi:PBP1b-binding outer membrane lipoprotein LpoB
MTPRGIVLFAVLLLAGCVDEPTATEAEKASIAVETELAQDAVKERQLSIEEAAEEATKLIEADAKAEADAAVAENP